MCCKNQTPRATAIEWGLLALISLCGFWTGTGSWSLGLAGMLVVLLVVTVLTTIGEGIVRLWKESHVSQPRRGGAVGPDVPAGGLLDEEGNPGVGNASARLRSPTPIQPGADPGRHHDGPPA